MDGSLIGRGDELAALLTAWREGSHGGAVLVGSGGVGKTRLAEECLAAAAQAGCATARIAGTRAAADLPLGAFAPLLPELGQEPLNLLLWARRRLLERAGDRPLVLFVDDAHTLDAVSAALVASIVTDRSAFVVITVRRDEPVADAITALWKDGHAVRVDLFRLDDDDVVRLACSLVGGELDEGTSEDLVRLASGNPLALRELVLGARAAGQLVPEGGRWRVEGRLPVTARLAELVSHRLGDLDDEGRRGLELVALGEPVDLDVLTRVVGDEVPAVLEEKGFVVLRARDGRDAVWLSHPLHGEVLRAELPGLRRRRLLADLHEAVSDKGDPGDELRLVVWAMELGRPADPDALEAAARRAWIAGELQRCADLARAAWNQRRTAEAGHLLGRALSHQERYDEAEAVLAEAQSLVAADRERTLVAMARSESLFRSEHLDEALAVVEETVAGIADADWAAELRGHGAMVRLLSGDPRAAMAEIDDALALGAGRPFVQAALVAGTALPWIGRPQDAIELTGTAWKVQEALQSDDLFQSGPGVHAVNLVAALCHSGRLAEAWELGTAARAEGNRRSVEGADPILSFLLGQVALRQGRTAVAADQLRRSVAGYRVQGPSHRRRFALSQLVEVAVVAGDLDAATLAAEEFAALEGSVLRFNRSGEYAALAWLAVGQGRFDDARAQLVEAAALGTDSGFTSGTIYALHSLARIGRADLAAEEAAALRPAIQGRLLETELDHVLAAHTGDADELEEVARAFADMGATLFAAEAWADAGRAHRKGGDPRRATAAARESARLAGQCEAAFTPALAVPGDAVPLSPREREVAVLAAQGLSSQAIADNLYLSRRTVENHLQRAYDKLGVRSRAELAAALGSG